jgi:large subunit ribosomal protein L9
MKLILTQNVEGVGISGETIQVKDGFARNFLLPRKQAVLWTKDAEAKINANKQRKDSLAQKEAETLSENLQKLEGLVLKYEEKLTGKGNLYGSIKADKIAGSVKEQTGLDLKPNDIIIKTPIRTPGVHNATIQLGSHQVDIKIELKEATAK